MIVHSRDIVAILNIGKPLRPDTKAFLQTAKEEGFVVYLPAEKRKNDFAAKKEPYKSAVVCQSAHATRVYYTPISAQTLYKRMGAFN